ncbi:MAG: NAD(P)/FAD-dependent oxidoreductase, partial [Bacteroidota bacterium]
MKGDVTIVGSGISGSVLALVLREIGYRVRLVDRQSHPRFSIGESSTPYADLVLRSLAKRYGLPDLDILSRYGLWSEQYPHLQGGPKRGFVYYPQFNPQKSADDTWEGEIVVASSRNRHLGDSNWVRSSLDQHLHQLCLDSDIECCDRFELTAADWRKNLWTLRFQNPNGESSECRTEFLIDASGNGSLANLLFGFSSEQDGFRTNTSAIFTHVHTLPEFRDILNENGFETEHYPFPPDESAMHHLTNEGWFWTLRFDDGRTSIGQLCDLNEFTAPLKPDSLEAWTRSPTFPSLLRKQLNPATLHTEPGQIIQSGRLQRR